MDGKEVEGLTCCAVGAGVCESYSSLSSLAIP